MRDRQPEREDTTQRVRQRQGRGTETEKRETD